jgi:hypothetical protein
MAMGLGGAVCGVFVTSELVTNRPVSLESTRLVFVLERLAHISAPVTQPSVEDDRASVFQFHDAESSRVQGGSS